MNDQLIQDNVRDEVTNYPAIASALTVTDQESFGLAGDAIKTLKGFQKEIVEFFGPMKKKAKAAHKEICDKENETLDPVKTAEALLRGRVNDFLQVQERIRVEAERRARIAADAEAEKERKRLEKRAETALAAGKDAKADELLEQAEEVYVAPVETVAPVEAVKVGNTHVGMSSKFEVEVLDMKAFVKALCDQGSAMTMLKVGQRELTAWAKSNDLKTFPGLRIEKTKVANIR